MILKNKRVEGFAAITLVLWTTIGLTSLLYSLVESYQYELANISLARQSASARSSALFCRDMILRKFFADSRFVPKIGEYINIFDQGRCAVTSFSSTVLQDDQKYTEQNELVTRGEFVGGGMGSGGSGGSSDVFYAGSFATTSASMKTRFDISNDLAEPFKLLYTVEI